MMTTAEIEKRIREMFAENYELLRIEGGHALADDSKEYALNQVLYYYKRMKDVAERVTDTEVKLTLPDQRTPEKRRFSIEGVVDIVREDDEVWMYDIKTHDPGFVRENKELYEKQLNVYSHIWENLRGNQLDHTAVISTAFPQTLKRAIFERDEKKIEEEMKKWDPLIEIPTNEEKVSDTISDFAKTVDLIEDHCFAPPPVTVLQAKVEGTNQLFATRVCRNCDARFSCSSFREYVSASGGKSQANFKKYYEDFGNDLDQEEWINGNINLQVINNTPESPE